MAAADPSAAAAAPPTSKFQQPEYVGHRVAMFERIYARQQAEASREPIRVTLPDGVVVMAKAGVTTPLMIASDISHGLAKAAVIAKVDDALWDLIRPLEKDCALQLLTFDSAEGQHTFWHSSAHVLGEALEWRFSGRLCVGPPIDDGGFYYDVHIPSGDKVSTDDYRELEQFINRIVKEKQAFQRVVLTKAEALEMFKFNPFKQEIIMDKIADGATCTAYRCGPLIDLCRGPHLPDTGVIKAFAITKNSGSYWKGVQGNDVLQRVYGISFPSKKQLKEWKALQKLAEERDHRRIGREQKLFFFHELSPGSCFFQPHGTRIYNRLVAYMRELYRRRGYDEVISPNVYNVELWKTSGHYQHYADNMFLFDTDKTQFAMKPMNCPGHCLMFRAQQRSYRELPLRMADFGVLHRNELAGALTGLTRVRRFQQDDAHIFCRADQVQHEVAGVLDMLREVYGVFGFRFGLALSTRPPKRIGSDAVWDAAETALRLALDGFGEPYTFNHGDGAFYGPKIDIEVTDALRRKHQCATVQLDFQLPQRFELQYTGADGSGSQGAGGQGNGEDGADQNRPVMIHRAILGSVERMMAILIEHTGGKWPFWLSPRQAIVVPVSETFAAYAQRVRDVLHARDFFVDVDVSARTLNRKVREAQLAQYNFILVVGQAELDTNTVNVRTRNNKVHGTKSLDDVAATFEQLRADKTRDEDVVLLAEMAQ